MKKVNKMRFVVTLVLLILIAAPAIIYAAQLGGFWPRPCITHWNMIKLMRDLNITEQQKTDIKNITEQTANDIKPIVQQMSDLRKEMNATFLAAEIDTAQAESQISEMVQLNSQINDKLLHAKLQEAQAADCRAARNTARVHQ